MILEKEVTIQINSSVMIPHYNKLGYNVKFKDIITIPVNHLPKGSHVIITGICEVCGKETKMMYKTYSENYYCKKCNKIKKNKTMLEKYGHEHALQCKEFSDKKKDTWIEIYGVDHAMKNENVKKKQEQTMMNKYNQTRALCNSDILTTMLNKQIDKYDMLFVETDEFKNKSKETCLEKYDTEYYLQSEDSKNKSRITCLKKYGVEYSSQYGKILQKILKSGYKITKYKDTNLYYQGSFEKDFLDLCDKINILDKITRGFSIRYDFNNKKLVYFPDFYFKEKNMIIEIKSTYWYNIHIDKNLAKEKACLDKKYNYILVLDKDYTNFLNIFSDT
jgi:hypothetical protein